MGVLHKQQSVNHTFSTIAFIFLNDETLHASFLWLHTCYTCVEVFPHCPYPYASMTQCHIFSVLCESDLTIVEKELFTLELSCGEKKPCWDFLVRIKIVFCFSVRQKVTGKLWILNIVPFPRVLLPTSTIETSFFSVSRIWFYLTHFIRPVTSLLPICTLLVFLIIRNSRFSYSV